MLGLIADDFTGASDAASFLAARGVSTLLYSGIPHWVDPRCGAAVIALKSRTQETQAAVCETLAALRVLKRAGADKFYLKYCSTFDSTPQGNIGPVVDAVMEALDIPCTVLDPALPVNGRTLRAGVLYVNGVPLAQSPMKDHPLTPMWASSLQELMAQQGKHKVVQVSAEVLADPARVSALRKAQAASSEKVYFVPDHWQDLHAEQIIDAFGDLPLLTGGSALAGAWGRCFAQADATFPSETDGPCLLLAGSCSQATRRQIAAWKAAGLPALAIQPELLGNCPERQVSALLDAVQGKSCLIYASADPEQVAALKAEYPHVDEWIETAMGALAAGSAARGCKRWIVAGGETSGAVTRALGFASFEIGRSIAPGVPVLRPTDAPHCRLVLKSGNFGGEDFFLRAWERTGTP